VRQRRLAETGRSEQQHVIQRLGAPARRLHEDIELATQAGLADEVIETPRTNRPLDGIVIVAADAAHHSLVLSQLLPRPCRLSLPLSRAAPGE
jgi:hypothetical protein